MTQEIELWGAPNKLHGKDLEKPGVIEGLLECPLPIFVFADGEYKGLLAGFVGEPPSRRVLVCDKQ